MTVSKIKNIYFEVGVARKKRHFCFLLQLLINIKYFAFRQIKQKIV